MTARPTSGDLRTRQVLVVALAALSGATDAVGLLALGGAFTSVMTGNLVLLGTASTTTNGALALVAVVLVVASLRFHRGRAATSPGPHRETTADVQEPGAPSGPPTPGGPR